MNLLHTYMNQHELYESDWLVFNYFFINNYMNQIMKVIGWFLQWHLCIQWIPWSKDMTKHHQRDPVTATRAPAWRKWPISRSQWPHYALRGSHDRCMLIRKHTKFCTRCTNTRRFLESSIYSVHMLCEFGMLDIS